MFLKRKWYYAVTTSVVITLCGGGYYMYRQEYQMVVTVPTADANDPNWPNKRIQFDTSEWLQQLQYIKIDDHYILNTQYTPIANLDDFGITLKLQNALNGSDKRLPALYGLAEMDVNRPGFPGECFICELRLPDHRFRWKHNKLFLLLPEEYGPAFPAIVDCYTSPPT